MYEGYNEITFSKQTANSLFSKFFSEFFQTSVTVTDVGSDYSGIKIGFTNATAVPSEQEEEKADGNA